MHQHGPRRLTVAPRAANLLVVGLHAARQRQVQHGADVRFVDAHAEGNRGHHHIQLTGEEVGLDALTHLGRQARVIGLRAMRGGKYVGHVLRGFAGRRVHDRRQSSLT